MSRTYEVLCIDCKQSLWIGQGWESSKRYIYKTNDHLKALEDFLFSHMGHGLVFDDSETLAGTIDYECINL